MKKHLLLAVVCLLAFAAAASAQATAGSKAQQTLVQKSKSEFSKLYDAAMEQLENDEFAKAAQLFQRALKLDPKSVEAYYHLGSCYYDLGLYIEAIAAYQQAVNLKPDYYEAIVYLGNALDYDGQYAKAVEMYKKAIVLRPDDWQPYFELGIAQYNQKSYNEAIPSFQESIKRTGTIGDPDRRASTTARAYYHLGDSFRMVQKYGEAVKAYQEALKLDDQNELAYYGLGLAYVGQGNAAAARQQYDKLRQMKSELASELLEEINKIQFAT